MRERERERERGVDCLAKKRATEIRDQVKYENVWKGERPRCCQRPDVEVRKTRIKDECCMLFTGRSRQDRRQRLRTLVTGSPLGSGECLTKTNTSTRRKTGWRHDTKQIDPCKNTGASAGEVTRPSRWTSDTLPQMRKSSTAKNSSTYLQFLQIHGKTVIPPEIDRSQFLG